MQDRMVTTLPNKLFTDGREVLARFGYRYAATDSLFEDWEVMWDKLRGDFAARRRVGTPVFRDLTAEQRAAAQAYMEARLQADRRLIACEKAHRSMLAEGVNPDLVELYTAAREAYEDSVESFGAQREALEALL